MYSAAIRRGQNEIIVLLLSVILHIFQFCIDESKTVLIPIATAQINPIIVIIGFKATENQM